MGLFELAPRAKEELAALAAHPENRGKGIRIFVEGLPHEEKTCWILFEEKPRPVDRIFLDDGLTFIVGPESAWYLKAKELDFDDDDGSFYITPLPLFAEEAYDQDEWAFLDDLPPEDEPWDDDEWELVADDEDEPPRREREPRDLQGTGGNRLPRGWRPSP